MILSAGGKTGNARNSLFLSSNNATGIGNLNQIVKAPTSEGDLAKVFGTELYFNRDKEFDLISAKNWKGAKPRESSSAWQYDSDYNWRAFGKEQFGDEFPKNIHLLYETPKLDFSYKHEFDPALNSVFKGKSGEAITRVRNTLEQVRSVAALKGGNGLLDFSGSNAETGMYVSMYKDFPVWKGSSATGLNEVTLKFFFGQAGEYDAYREVVVPILTLARMNAPSVTKSNNGATRLHGPMKTGTQFLSSMVVNGIGGFFDGEGGLSIGKDDGDAGLGVIAKSADKILSATYSAFDRAVSNSIADCNLFYFRLGRAIYGPALIKSVSWSFDFTEVDSKGYPTQGFISFKDVSKLTSVCKEDLDMFEERKSL